MGGRRDGEVLMGGRGRDGGGMEGREGRMEGGRKVREGREGLEGGRVGWMDGWGGRKGCRGID